MLQMVRVVFIVLLLLLSSVAHAEKRVALVIGNSAYQYTPRLDNPKNDATDIAALLKKLGFEVLDGFDLNKVDFERNKGLMVGFKAVDFGTCRLIIFGSPARVLALLTEIFYEISKIA